MRKKSNIIRVRLFLADANVNDIRGQTHLRSDYLYSRCMPLLKRRRWVYQFTQDQVTLYVYIAQLYIHLPSAKCVIRLKRCEDSFIRSKTWRVFPIHYVCIHYPCKEEDWFAIKETRGYPECPLVIHNSVFPDMLDPQVVEVELWQV